MENEKRLISVCAWDSFYKQQTHGLEEHDHYCDGYGDAFDHVDDWMDAQPIVDAVEVVRCKDCKQWNCAKKPKGCDKRLGYCLNDDEPIARWEIDFCSYGERKDYAGTPRDRLD